MMCLKMPLVNAPMAYDALASHDKRPSRKEPLYTDGLGNWVFISCYNIYLRDL